MIISCLAHLHIRYFQQKHHTSPMQTHECECPLACTHVINTHPKGAFFLHAYIWSQVHTLEELYMHE